MAKPDRPLLAEGTIACLRKDERGQAILAGHFRRSLLANRRRELSSSSE
jgi:hypothetical protein